MLLIVGKIYEVAPSTFTDSATGEVKQEFSVEVIHKENNKTVITSIKIDETVVPEWTKNIGKEFNAQVRPWAMKMRDGIKIGLALVDKKSLPNLMKTSTSAPLAAVA